MPKKKSEKYTEDVMQGLAAAVNEVLKNETGRKMGFVLLVFDPATPKLGNYVSNCSRADMITCMRETADRLEKREDIPRTPNQGDISGYH